MRTSNSHRDLVQSVVRAFEILGTFTLETPHLGVSEIAARVDLNRTTVHRLLATLEHCGVIIQDPVSRKYRLSARVLQYANVFLHRSDIRSVALDPMTRLRDETGETCGLHVREHWTRVIIAQVESTQALRMTYPNLGEAVPLHLGAPGRVILAFLPEHQIESYLAQKSLVRLTAHSLTDPRVLRHEIEVIRRQGYAVSRQERRQGVVSIAAPIFDRQGQVVASVNVSGPLQRLDDEAVATIAPLVVRAAQDISWGLSHLDEPIAGAGGITSGGRAG